MPGFGMGLRLAPRLEHRLEQRLAQRLEIRILQQLLLLGGEEPYDQQTEILEAIKEDLDQGVYSDVDEFHYRLMKRIKIEKRTKPVKWLVESLRDLIDSDKEIDLDDIKDVVDLGLKSLDNMELANNSIDSLSNLSKKVDDSLESIVNVGKGMLGAEWSASIFYDDVVAVGKKSKGEISVQEGYDRAKAIISNHPLHRKTFGFLFRDAMKKRKNYGGYGIGILFDLIEQDCELAVPGHESYKLIPASSLIGKKNLEGLIKKNSNIPLPILAELSCVGINEEAMARMNEYAGTKAMRKSRDNKRSFLTSFVGIRNYRFNKKVIEDILLKSKGIKQARDILSKFSGLCRIGLAHYSFDLPDGDAIVEYLSNKRRFSNPILNQLSQEALTKFERDLDRHDTTNIHAYDAMLKLGEIYAKTYPSCVGLLTKVMENLIMDRFSEFRYESKIGREQLVVLGGCTEEWRKNSFKKRVVGDIKGLEPQYKAIMKIAESMEEKFKEIYCDEITEGLIEWMKVRKETLLKEHSINPPKEVIQELNFLNSKYNYARVVKNLKEAKLEDFFSIDSIVSGSLRKDSHEEFRMNVNNINEIVSQSKYGGSKIKQVVVRETDDPNIVIDVGCLPVRSCQRWTEKTSYNDCLLAYVTDANKKVFQVLDDLYKVRVRSIVRLFKAKHHGDQPVLFLERPYANAASKELYKALLSEVVLKAFDMSKELGKPVYVAARDSDYCKILKKMAKDAGKGLTFKMKGFEAKMAPSHNQCEYTDGFGGRVRSGSVVSAKNVGYVRVNHESNAE